MIQITIDDLTIKVTGHAAHAEKGRDIVCAAISTLTYSLISFIESNTEMFDDISIKSGDGIAVIDCIPFPEYEAVYRAAQEVIIKGYMAVADSFPINAAVTINARR